MIIKDEVIKKWEILINACKAYYVDSLPTGLLDSKYDELEKRALIEDNFHVRDYVFHTYLKGTKTKNSWIDKIKKIKVTDGPMIQALVKMREKLNQVLWCSLKYDGSSIAIYLDPTTGIPKRVVTVGNLNLDNYGVDQTWKLLHFLPKKFPKGIVAIHAEALVDTVRLGDSDPDRARQKANGLINSKYAEAEVNDLLTIRAFRYFVDNSPEGDRIRSFGYRDVLDSFPVVRSKIDGRTLFSPAQVWSIDELIQLRNTEVDCTETRDGIFLNDGWVVYDEIGICIAALKFAGAGKSTEAIKTKVLEIQWNSQVQKGKDSWSANVIIDPVQIKGCTIKKPSAGSVSKLIKSNITPGAEIGIILANSTIPMVGEVFSPGNGNFMWPTCTCGYQLSEVDIYGSLLKCGNIKCTERYTRMFNYLQSLEFISPDQLDLNKFLVLDRFKWQDTNIDLTTLLSFVVQENKEGYYNYLKQFMKTTLQIRNLDLIWLASFVALDNSRKQ